MDQLDSSPWLLMAWNRFGAKAPAMYTRYYLICTWYEFLIDLQDLFPDIPNGCNSNVAIDLIHKSQFQPVPYPTMLHSEPICRAYKTPHSYRHICVARHDHRTSYISVFYTTTRIWVASVLMQDSTADRKNILQHKLCTLSYIGF